MEEMEPKEAQLEAIRMEVNKIADLQGTPIDEGIKESVVYLKALNFPVSSSCEGHLTDEEGLWLPRVPYVEFYPKVPTGEDWFENPVLRERVLGESERIRKDAEKLIAEFDESNEIALTQTAYGWRLQPAGDLEGLEEREAAELLDRQQALMKKFTEYLKDIF